MCELPKHYYSVMILSLLEESEIVLNLSMNEDNFTSEPKNKEICEKIKERLKIENNVQSDK